MNLFLKGKNLEDLEIAADSKMKDFYEKITFRAIIVYYEFIVNINKYKKFDLNKFLNVFIINIGLSYRVGFNAWTSYWPLPAIP